MPAEDADSRCAEMARFTAHPDTSVLPELLEWLSSPSGSLIVLNHPLWDESVIGGAAHTDVVDRFLLRHWSFIHALELNGLRSWRESKSVLELAERFRLPAVSGGDRHDTAPNAILNLTNAANFHDFAEEVKSGTAPEVLLMPQYRQSHTFRILQSIADIISAKPEHSLGWTSVCDRVFHVCDDGSARSLSQSLGGRMPRLLAALLTLSAYTRQGPFCSAVQLALGGEEDLA